MMINFGVLLIYTTDDSKGMELPNRLATSLKGCEVFPFIGSVKVL